jgi:hypothetical protein
MLISETPIASFPSQTDQTSGIPYFMTLKNHTCTRHHHYGHYCLRYHLPLLCHFFHMMELMEAVRDDCNNGTGPDMAKEDLMFYS